MADPTAPAPTSTPPADTSAPKPPEAPKVDVAALQAEMAKLQQEHRQAVAALAAIQADQQPAPQAAPEPELSPEFQTQATAFFKKELAHLAPFLQQIDQRLQQIATWQSGQQLRQAAQEIDLPTELETEVQNLMAQYAGVGRSVSHQTALAHVLGNREIARLRQEAINSRAKAKFNSSILPAFSGSGALPNLAPVNGQRPGDNDIAAWANLANEHDLPL